MNIFVGNMMRDISKDNLKEVFQKFGAVETVTILIDRINGEWKAFGFVEMPDLEEATSAIQSMDGKELLGKNLVVHEARYRAEDRRNVSRKGGRRNHDDPEKS
ncbi:RNA recognition motif domain-containing protein [Candidatus Cloacimonadota bacterium]